MTENNDEAEATLGTYHHPAWGNLNFHAFLTAEIDYTIQTLLQEQTGVASPASIAPMNGRDDWYMLLHPSPPHYRWTVIQVHDEHTSKEIKRNAIVRILGTGDAAINTEGMGMFGGFWTYQTASGREIQNMSDPRADAEVWFDRKDQ